jgi:ankyrin repeat domain-containing protein 50
MPGPRSKRDWIKTVLSPKPKRSSQPSQSISSPLSNATEQPGSTIAPLATTGVPTSIPSTDGPQLPNQPIGIIGASSPPTRQPNSAVSSHQSVADAYSKDLWSKALQRLSEQDRASILGLMPPPVGDTDSGTALLDELCGLALKKKEKCDEKGWKLNFNGQQVILRDVALKIIFWLQKFKEVGDIAANFDPVHAALPWAAFRFLLQVLFNNHNGEIRLSSLVLTPQRLLLQKANRWVHF